MLYFYPSFRQYTSEDSNLFMCPPNFMFCEYVMKDLVATTPGMQWLKCLASTK